ncbi:hypothetical protein P154DRAFT_62669 [Amniculicola lignicola CBS 123094]|uniref:Thioredoxin domain-containing protein n=1 Tax=Amniculicola lignicola CBS 123094 TaxID=1392246 RepID=A0A6A5W0K6_9PLEO|nr:hypothetical protein P154DRAFT_62669 [Amniculicola lignicola CBS 123094]
MILRPLITQTIRVLTKQTSSSALPQRNLSLFPSSSSRPNQNRIFTPIRTQDELHTLTMLSAADNRPLITFWSANWCRTCQTLKPLVQELVEEEGVGESEGGLGWVVVEIDAVGMGDGGVRFGISSLPTLLAFSRQEPQNETKVTDSKKMKDRVFLREWLEAMKGLCAKENIRVS